MTSIRNTPIADRSAIVIVALLTAVFAFIAYQPWRLYFFGDTWDILCEFHENGWTTIWRMHNEHFMPVSKAVLYVQYALFGMHNLPYQAVSIAIHSLNAALLYIAAGQLTGMVIPRLFGALFFGFSGVYWELTMWEAGQQTTLAMLFILLSLILGRQYLRQGKAAPLAGAMASALFATWSMGYGLLASPLLAVEAIISLLSQAPVEASSSGLPITHTDDSGRLRSNAADRSNRLRQRQTSRNAQAGIAGTTLDGRGSARLGGLLLSTTQRAAGTRRASSARRILSGT